MNRLIAFLFIVFLIAVTVIAATRFVYNAKPLKVDTGQVVNFTGFIENTDTLTSDAFTLKGTTFTIWSTLSLGTASTRKISVQILGSGGGVNYTPIDTLLISDSVTTTRAQTFDFNGKVPPYMKLIIFGTGANDSTYFNIALYGK